MYKATWRGISLEICLLERPSLCFLNFSNNLEHSYNMINALADWQKWNVHLISSLCVTCQKTNLRHNLSIYGLALFTFHYIIHLSRGAHLQYDIIHFYRQQLKTLWLAAYSVYLSWHAVRTCWALHCQVAHGVCCEATQFGTVLIKRTIGPATQWGMVAHW